MRDPGALTRAEIAEQPDRWTDLVTAQRDAWMVAAGLVLRARPELVAFVARGSSDNAALYGQYLVTTRLGIPALSALPSTHSLADRSMRYPRAVQVALSQSGGSPDLLATSRALRAAGVPMVAATNDPRSELARAADVHLSLNAGPELSVAATKSYTAELLAVHTLVQLAAEVPLADLEAELHALAAAGRSMVDDAVAAAPALLAALDGVERVLVVGRGLSTATAKEGALKLMETSGVAASGWSAADAAHGPLGQVGPGSAVIALTAGELGRESVVSVAHAARARGARIIEIGPQVLDPDAGIPVPTAPSPELVPVLEVIPLQALAVELALAHGRDPDAPVGLSKVTLTR